MSELNGYYLIMYHTDGLRVNLYVINVQGDVIYTHCINNPNTSRSSITPNDNYDRTFGRYYSPSMEEAFLRFNEYPYMYDTSYDDIYHASEISQSDKHQEMTLEYIKEQMALSILSS